MQNVPGNSRGVPTGLRGVVVQIEQSARELAYRLRQQFRIESHAPVCFQACQTALALIVQLLLDGSASGCGTGIDIADTALGRVFKRLCALVSLPDTICRLPAGGLDGFPGRHFRLQYILHGGCSCFLLLLGVHHERISLCYPLTIPESIYDNMIWVNKPEGPEFLIWLKPFAPDS